jgi:Protein of unknown function (DUF3485)
MCSSIRRQALVLILIAVAGVASVVLRAEVRSTPPVPTVDKLTSGSDWQPQGDPYEGAGGAVYRQWLLRDSAGNQAVLYIGVTGRVQTMANWSGELGYEGEGYSVRERSDRMLDTGDGHTATVGTALLQRLSTRRLVEYAVVDPDGIIPRGTDTLAQAAWDVLRGQGGPYYLVRASVVADAQDAAVPQRSADRLLVTVLPHLLAQATSS